MNAVEAVLGRFSGAPDGLQVLSEQSGYLLSDIGYLRMKISDNGQKRRNELFGSILVVQMQLRRIWVCFGVLRMVWKYFWSDSDISIPISDIW